MKSHTTDPDEPILLVDSSNITAVKEFMRENTGFRIISFDYSSHVDLQRNSITHEISDDYLSESDIETLQNKAYQLSDWAADPRIEEYLDYNGFNLGKLFYTDIFIYLIPVLKKLHEVQQIFKEWPSATYYCSGQLYQMMKLINPSVHAISESETTEPEFYYDYIKIQNNILKIKIPRSYYFKFKQFLELGIHYMFGPRKHSASNGTLVVEFNTNQYDRLFINSRSQGEHIVFYGRKRPAFWNLRSFSIIKKSKCTVITPHVLTNKNLDEIISNDLIKINEKAKLLYDQNAFFQSFFSLNGVSFWGIMKPFFVDLCSRRFNETVTELQFAAELLKKFKPKLVMVLSESGYTEQFVIHEAKRLQIPVMLVQHGLGAFDSPKSDEINKFTGSVPILSDMFLVWGNAMARYSKQLGIPDEKIKIVGSPSHDKTFEIAQNYAAKKEFVLVSAGSTTHNHINDYTVKANEEYLRALRTICKTVTKAGKKLVIKLHPYIDDQNERELAREVDPSIQIIRKGSILSMLQSCEFFITVHITSAILDAQILNKPVLRMPLGEWWGPANYCRPDPGLTVSPENFEEIFTKITRDKDFYDETVRQGRKFVDDCLVNFGTASNKILELVKNAL